MLSFVYFKEYEFINNNKISYFLYILKSVNLSTTIMFNIPLCILKSVNLSTTIKFHILYIYL